MLNSRGVQLIHFRGCAGLERCRHQAKHHQRACQGPSALFQKVGRALYATDLLGSGETGRQATAFGVLRQYDEGEKCANDEDDDGEYIDYEEIK